MHRGSYSFMRNVAYRVPLRLLQDVTPHTRDGVQYFRLPNGVSVKRVGVWGVVVHKIVGENYLRLVLDDFTGTIAVVFFPPYPPRAESVEVGDTVFVVGRLRERDGEVSVAGEALKMVDPIEELVRRLDALRFTLSPPAQAELPPVSTAPRLEAPATAPESEDEELETVETIDLEGDEW